MLYVAVLSKHHWNQGWCSSQRSQAKILNIVCSGSAHMCITCRSHAGHTYITCRSHAGHTYITCRSHVHHMQIIRTSHASHMYITCRSHTSDAGHMYITCWSHVHHMLVTCTSHAGHVHYMQVTVHHMQVTCTSHAGHILKHLCFVHSICHVVSNAVKSETQVIALTPGLSCQCSKHWEMTTTSPHNPVYVLHSRGVERTFKVVRL